MLDIDRKLMTPKKNLCAIDMSMFAGVRYNPV